MSNLPLFKSDEMFTAPVRLLVKESHAIFTTIPRNNVEMTKSDIITISRRYRSIVHECVENLTRDVKNDHIDQIKTFRELEVIWNLCEILLLDVNQIGTLIIQLKNWIKMHFDELCDEAKNIIIALDNNNYKFTENSNPDVYWNVVTKLVLRGELKKAIQLLKCHYEYERDDQLKLVSSMMEKMPMSNQYIVHEFYNKWSCWSESCKRERETGQFDNNRALLNIVRLFCQDLDVYEEFASSCETWYQLMVAYLLYNDPCIKTTDLSELCRRSISMFKQNNFKYKNDKPEPNEFDEIIISAFEYDLIQVIARCCSYLDDNWWFVTHFVDLLYCSNQLKIHEIVESDKMRENFLQDYASTLFDDEHLWPLGISYLDNCHNTGIFFLETLISRVPIGLHDDIKTNKIISMANKRGLMDLTKSVCLLMARNWLAKTPKLDDDSIKIDKYKRTNETTLPPAVNLSNALYWAVKSGDIPITTYVSDQYLYYYCKTNTFPDESVFENLTRSLILNERLAFLAKYYEFKQIVLDSSNDMRRAGDLISALLASKIYPNFFCNKLLEDSKNLLEHKPQLVFEPKKALHLMRSVEEITKEGMIDDDVGLRKNIVRNMARALITPNVYE